MTAKFDKFKEALIALCDLLPTANEALKNLSLAMERLKQPAPTPPAQPPHQIT